MEKDLKIIKRMIRIPLKNLALATSSCPLVGIFLCIVISMMKDFEGVNHTHCNVYNFLPSLSASIGNYTPQRYIWRIAVALHIAPRILFAFLYYAWHGQDSHRWGGSTNFRAACRANLALCLLELSCLIGLTYVSSNEDYRIHEKCFILFVVFAVLYMITTCYLCHRRRAPVHPYSYRFKMYMFCTFVTSIVSFTYLFERHNLYCEPYVYSLFAFFEYLCVISNIGFHTSAVFDFRDQTIVISNLQTEGDMLNGYLVR